MGLNNSHATKPQKHKGKYLRVTYYNLQFLIAFVLLERVSLKKNQNGSMLIKWVILRLFFKIANGTRLRQRRSTTKLRIRKAYLGTGIQNQEP